MPPASDISVRFRSIPVLDWVPLFRYRTKFPHLHYFSFGYTGLTRCRAVRHSSIYRNCTQYCWWRIGIHPASPYTAACGVQLYFVMLTNHKYSLECKEKVSPASAFLPVVSPASAFRNQGQSGTDGHGLVRHCPALVVLQWSSIGGHQYCCM
jgi:hypothetical protein